jgi:integrase
MRQKITKTAVDATRPSTKTLKVYDTEVRGFLLVVTPAGAKSYAIEYRAGSGRSAPMRRMVIGKHGVLTPEQARRLAREKLAEVTRGGDPVQARKAEREAMTVTELCDLYLAEGTAHKKASTLKADRARIEHHLKPLLGRKRVEKLTRGDIERLLVDVKAGKTALAMPAIRPSGSIPTGGSGVAAQCVTLMGTMLSFAMKRGLRPDNPAHGIRKPPVRKLTRFLNEAEIGRLAGMLDAEATTTGNPYPAAAIKLLLLTGCRRGEIMSLRWQHVDAEHACLRLPDSKTREKIVYLNPPALVLLGQLPEIAGNPYVIAGERPGLPFGGLDKVWSRIRAAAELPDVRLHDLRHSFASIGAAGGLGLPIIGALLGHREPRTTQRYAHLGDNPLRQANDAIGARIAAAMVGGTGQVTRPQRRRS